MACFFFVVCVNFRNVPHFGVTRDPIFRKAATSFLIAVLFSSCFNVLDIFESNLKTIILINFSKMSNLTFLLTFSCNPYQKKISWLFFFLHFFQNLPSTNIFKISENMQKSINLEKKQRQFEKFLRIYL